MRRPGPDQRGCSVSRLPCITQDQRSGHCSLVVVALIQSKLSKLVFIPFVNRTHGIYSSKMTHPQVYSIYHYHGYQPYANSDAYPSQAIKTTSGCWLSHPSSIFWVNFDRHQRYQRQEGKQEYETINPTCMYANHSAEKVWKSVHLSGIQNPVVPLVLSLHHLLEEFS